MWELPFARGIGFISLSDVWLNIVSLVSLSYDLLAILPYVIQLVSLLIRDNPGGGFMETTYPVLLNVQVCWPLRVSTDVTYPTIRGGTPINHRSKTVASRDHRIGSVLHSSENEQTFLQIYLVGNDGKETEVQSKIFPAVKPWLVTQLQKILHNHNQYVQNFKTTMDNVPNRSYSFKF